VAARPAQDHIAIIGEWWRERVARVGVLRTAFGFAVNIWQFVRESTPARRRQRYGDVDFDWDFRVDTTAATVSWRDRLLGLFLSPYQATDPTLLHEMLASLNIDFKQFTFVDLGSGKGRTLLLASDYAFKRIVGVEFLPALHRIAQQNIGKYNPGSQKCRQVVSTCADARRYAFPLEPLVLYLFNPLPEPGFEQVVSNLGQSWRQVPRPVYVLYHNPLLEHVLARSAWLRKIGGTHQYSIYAANPADPANLAARQVPENGLQ
jgi:SAM-dependent methyltransferase